MTIKQIGNVKEVVQEKANAATVCMKDGLLGILKCQNVIAQAPLMCVSRRNQKQEKKDNIVCGSMNKGLSEDRDHGLMTSLEFLNRSHLWK